MNNPIITYNYFVITQMTNNFFEFWFDLIPHMNYDFEWRRSMMAFLSIFVLDISHLESILTNNMSFFLKKIIYFGENLIDYYKRKKLKKGQGDEEGSEVDI